MTVYVVTSGSYSSYSIDGVFSTEEKAKEFMGNSPEGEFCIEPYELDKELSRVYGPVWIESLKLDGSGSRSWESGPRDLSDAHYAGDRGTGRTVDSIENDDWRLLHQDYAFFEGTSYVSKEHAIKLAVEARQKTLREHPEYFVKPTTEQVQQAIERQETAEARQRHSYPHIVRV